MSEGKAESSCVSAGGAGDPLLACLFGPKRLPARMLQAALDLMFPARCEVCGVCLAGEPNPVICRACFSRIKRITTACRRCGAPTRAPLAPRETCPECKTHPPRWCSAVGAAAIYEEPLRSIILSFKFGRNLYLEGLLAELLTARVRDLHLAAGCNAIVPVPITRATFRDRGFNQAEMIARYAGRSLGLPVRASWLEKIRETSPQAKLPASRRRANLAGAFRAPDPRAVRGKRILLVDDVLTTGATLSECAATLKAAGAAELRGAVVARAVETLWPSQGNDGDENGKIQA